MFAALLAVAPIGLARADAPVSENASRRFSQGVRHMTGQDPDRYEKAYREFKAAYADSPSWKILGNLGICANELERDGEAIDAFKGSLERGGKELSADERKQFTEDLQLVESGSATLTIQTAPDGAWIVDERLPDSGSSVLNRYGPTSGPLTLRVRAGHHRIRAELSGYEGEVWEFSTTAGSSVTHAFDLRRAHVPSEAAADASSEPFDDRLGSSGGSSGWRVGSYVAFGLGAVGVGAGTWFLIDGFDKRKQADQLFVECSMMQPGGADGCAPTSPLGPGAIKAEADEADAFTRSLVGYIAGGAFVTAGLVMFLVSPSEAESGAKGREKAALTPWLGPQGFGVSGRF